MKFIQANIYGFGKWIDQVVDFKNKHPVCFYGENESGKSTLQQFILYVLFGLPPRKLASFRPLYSNKIGGRLTIQDRTIGRYEIERMEQEVICYLPTGELQDEAWLAEQLQGINRNIYTSIYAFAATDLLEIRQMKKAQLSNVLFSVGLSGSTNIYGAEKVLETKIDQLFKKQGKNPLINKQIHVVKEGYDTLLIRQKKEATYQNKRLEIKKLLQEKDENIKEEERYKTKLLKTERIIQHLPHLQKYHHLQEQMKTEQSIGPFPEDGLERLEHWQEKLHPLQGELRVTNMQIQTDEQAVQEIQASLQNQTWIESAKGIIDKRPTYEYLLQQEKELSSKINELQDEVVNELATVQIEEKSLSQLDFPFHLEKDWKKLQQTHERLLENEASQTESYDSLMIKEAETEKKMAHQQQQLASLNNENVQSLSQFTGESSSRKGAEQRKWREWENRRMKTAKIVLISASILSVITILIALFADNAILYALPVVILLAGVLQYMNIKNTIAFILRETEIGDAQAMHTNDEMQASIMIEQQRINSALQETEEEVRQLAVAKDQWKKDQAVFLKEENMWIQSVETMRQRYPFLQHVEIENWLHLLSILRNVRRLQRDKERREKELDDLQAEIDSINQMRKELSYQLSEKKGLLSFEQIQDIIDKHHTEIHFLDQYRKQINNRTETMKALNEKKAIVEEEIEKLFHYANAPDEETYLQLAASLNHQQKMRENRAELKRLLTQLLSPKEIEDILQQPLVEKEWTNYLQTLEEQLERVQEQQTKLNKSIASIEMEIKQLELSEEHSTAIYQQQMEKDTLQQMGQQWASLKVAQAALGAAKTAYQQHYFDEVLQQTTSFFRFITDGVYTKVIAPSEKGVFQVEGEDQIRYTVDMLSRGTIDQLYVSLRLAIGKVMSKIHHMPFMVDDAFVHFDSVRLSKMIHLLKSIHYEQQIIIFTCREDIAEAFDHVHTLR